jgi:hypothetical protein
MVQDIEEFRAELECCSLSKEKILVSNEIQVLEWRPGQVIAAFVTKGVGTGKSKGRRVESLQAPLGES